MTVAFRGNCESDRNKDRERTVHVQQALYISSGTFSSLTRAQHSSSVIPPLSWGHPIVCEYGANVMVMYPLPVSMPHGVDQCKNDYLP
jgi:hypothetical protein